MNMDAMEMQKTEVIRLDISETKHAFRVNGVTLAKRHLNHAFTGPSFAVGQQALYQYLAVSLMIAHDEYDPARTEGLNASQNYLTKKAFRVEPALGLNDNQAKMAFLFACAKMAGVDVDAEAVGVSVMQVTPEQANGLNVIPFGKRVLH